MKDEGKTKKQLTSESAELRQRVAQLETSETECRSVCSAQAGKQKEEYT